ncbi:MAG: helicase HerA-like domain-containing protein [Gemmatimonadota bacterium]
MNDALIAAAKSAFPTDMPGITLGAVLHEGAIDPQPLVRLPLSMMTRHGLIAGATGTGKTKTLQLMAEQLSAHGVPVFLADVKGDASGIAAAGSPHPKIDERAKATGYAWSATSFPVELLSLTGTSGGQLRATVSDFGPLLLSKVLGLNETQASVLALVFKYCDDKGLLLLDLSDLREVLQYLSEDGAAELKEYGGMSKATVGVLLRNILGLEAQGADRFFGEPAFDLNDLLSVERDGRGLVSVLALSDVEDKPALFSTFMLWMLAELYAMLPEVGDLAKPKLVFFLDEAHLLFADASKSMRDEIEKVVRLVRSKGVGVFFITQHPRDIPETVLGQLGNRVQHALRAFTPDDEKQLRTTARTIPKTEFYEIEEVLTTLGTGEALVSTLTAKGTPTLPFACHMVPPASRMGPLTEAEIAPRLTTPQARKYATAVDRESAREMLEKKHAEHAAMASANADAAADEKAAKVAASKSPREDESALGAFLRSPVARTIAVTVAGTITRSLLGTLMGKRRR